MDKSINFSQERVRNTISVSIPEALNQNLNFNKLPRKMHSHYSQRSTDVKETSLGLERSRPWSCHLLLVIYFPLFSP